MEPQSRRIPPWLILLELVAMLAVTAGVIRIFVPELDWLSDLPKPLAWGCIVVGLAVPAVSWVFFLKVQRERRAERG